MMVVLDSRRVNDPESWFPSVILGHTELSSPENMSECKAPGHIIDLMNQEVKSTNVIFNKSSRSLCYAAEFENRDSRKIRYGKI
jgi:hypothetical protein